MHNLATSVKGKKELHPSCQLTGRPLSAGLSTQRCNDWVREARTSRTRRLTFLNYSLHSRRSFRHQPNEWVRGGLARMPRRLIISRRKFLRHTILGTAFLAVARLFPRDFLVARSTNGIPADLRYFCPQEYLILQAAAERIIGPAAASGSRRCRSIPHLPALPCRDSARSTGR